MILGCAVACGGDGSASNALSVVIWNSGLLESDDKIYAGLHAPMAYFIGGPDDVAYKNAESDFGKIDKVPVFYANAPVGHLATPTASCARTACGRSRKRTWTEQAQRICDL